MIQSTIQIKTMDKIDVSRLQQNGHVLAFYITNPVIRSADDIPQCVKEIDAYNLHAHEQIAHGVRFDGVTDDLNDFLKWPIEEQARVCCMDYRIGTTLYEYEFYSGIKYFMDRQRSFETQEDCINIISHIAHLLVIIPADEPELCRRFTKTYNRYIDNARKKFNIGPTTPCDKGEAI